MNTMSEQNRARVLSGKVVSDKMDKTITVLVERRVKHPVYGKYISKSSKVKAHDESNDSKEGDLVTIRESRPLATAIRCATAARS